jgi:hypothetical protein
MAATQQLALAPRETRDWQRKALTTPGGDASVRILALATMLVEAVRDLDQITLSRRQSSKLGVGD